MLPLQGSSLKSDCRRLQPFEDSWLRPWCLFISPRTHAACILNMCVRVVAVNLRTKTIGCNLAFENQAVNSSCAFSSKCGENSIIQPMQLDVTDVILQAWTHTRTISKSKNSQELPGARLNHQFTSHDNWHF